MSMHSGTPKSGPWLLQASQHYSVDKQDQDITASQNLCQDDDEHPSRYYVQNQHQDHNEDWRHAQPWRPGDQIHSGQYKSGSWLLQASYHDYLLDPRWQDGPYDGPGHEQVDLKGDHSYQGHPMYNPHDADDTYFLQGEHGTPLEDTEEYSVPEHARPEQRMSMHSGQYKSGPWLLEASRHVAYDIQSPAPGEPMQTKRGPQQPSTDPANDPMGHLETRPYDYNTMVNNLVSHHNGATDDERKQGRLWYKAAHDLFHTFAKNNNITPERAVSYGSAFSPLTDWGDNVHHAQKFMLGYRPGDPDFNPHDWQTAHIAQEPLDAFRQQNGRDPSHSDEDLNALADLHAGRWQASKTDAKKGLPGKDDIAGNPEARQQWMENIQHKGMPATLEDQARQAEAWRKDPKRKGPYNPAYSMRASGINTLGGNIQKAKDLYHSPEDVAQMFKVLGGPKISHFTDNILDDTPIDSEGYYQHPNGDWTQNQDLGGTIDSHHIRASSMPHGGWERKPYAAKNPNTDHEYDVFNRGLLDATRHINSQQPDPTKHITPKQLQAIVWLKHKNDKDYFERQRNPQTGQLINHQSELGQNAARPEDWQFAEKSYKSKGKGLGRGRAAALEPQEFHNLPPLWRKMFMSGHPQEWTDLLHDYVQHYSPGNYQTEDPNFHEGAIEPDWHTTSPQPKVGPRPRLKPRRPNAPRMEHKPRKTLSWYLPERTASRWYITAEDDAPGSDITAEDDVPGSDKERASEHPAGGDASGAVGTPAGVSGGQYGDWSGDPHAAPMPGAAPLSGGPSGGGSSSSTPSSYSPGAGGKQWEQQVNTALDRNGLPRSLTPQVEHQIDTESSGNPKAINNWDSNAQAGHPSQGLLQTIPGTFNQYHLPGDSMDITDPQANLDAAIGYGKSRYGPTLMNNGNGLGSGHGY